MSGGGGGTALKPCCTVIGLNPELPLVEFDEVLNAMLNPALDLLTVKIIFMLIYGSLNPSFPFWPFSIILSTPFFCSRFDFLLQDSIKIKQQPHAVRDCQFFF